MSTTADLLATLKEKLKRSDITYAVLADRFELVYVNLARRFAKDSLCCRNSKLVQDISISRQLTRRTFAHLRPAS